MSRIELETLDNPNTSLTNISVLFKLPGMDLQKEIPLTMEEANKLVDNFKSKYPQMDIKMVGTVAINSLFAEASQDDANTLVPLVIVASLIAVAILLKTFFGTAAVLLMIILTKVQNNNYETYELVGLGLSAGILLATNGINVAHELGHRESYFERFLSQLLYVPCLYMHFYIEHNFGHHLKVATPEDGATAKYNQPLYSFWLSSVTRQYISAWKIQIQKLKSGGHYFFSIKNNMLFYHIIQPIYLFGIYYFFSLNTMMFSILIGVVSFLFLECINYIEHYGLRRFKTNSNRYERVQPHHSWNSNFNIGRITLYELTRHSDHHYKSSKKYQVLNSHDECPTLPFGYPASILLSFFPPIWFWIMNPRVPKTMKSNLKNS